MQAMAQRLPAEGLLCRMMIADDDSTMRARTMKGQKCEMKHEYEVHRFGADPSHRTRTFGGRFYKLANKKLPNEQHGDSRLNSLLCTKFKSYHGYATHLLALF